MSVRTCWSRFFLSLSVLCALALLAESSVAQNTLDLQGLAAEEVEKHFGAPDQKRQSGSGKETWTYGRSIVLFREGKISAWSDAGELSRRSKLAKVRSLNSRAEQEREHWKNPWSTQTLFTNREILSDLLAEADAQSAHLQRGAEDGDSDAVKRPEK